MVAARWSRWRRLAAAVVVGLVIGVAVPAFVGDGPAVPQPVAFNHLKHTQELGLPCDFCHPYAQASAHSGLPDGSTCSMCHTEVQGTSTEAARVTALLEAGDSLRFHKLFRLPDHVFYTHQRHVAIAELECARCHGAIAETTQPPDHALVPIDMEFCMDCHRESGASLDCNACHR